MWLSPLSFYSAYSMNTMKVSSLCEWQGWQRKEEEGEGSSESPFTLQERIQRGVEGRQSLAQPAWEDTTLNMLISPLISTQQYLVLGKECEKLAIMSNYHSTLLCCSNSTFWMPKTLVIDACWCQLVSSNLHWSHAFFIRGRFTMH